MKYTIVLLSIMLLVVGCSSTQYVCPNGDVVENAEECQEEQKPTITSSPYDEVTKEPAVVQKPKVTKPVEKKVVITPNDPEITELLQKARDLTSLEYQLFLRHEQDQRPLHVFTNDEKMRMILPEDTTVEDDVDTVIFDLKTKVAQGYCESQERCLAQGQTDLLSFDTYHVASPFDWLSKVRGASIESQEVIDKRKVYKVSTSGGEVMWLDTYYGVPLKVVDGQETFDYQQVIFNRVKDTDLEFSERD